MENEMLKQGGKFTLTTFLTLLSEEDEKRKEKGLQSIFILDGKGKGNEPTQT